MIDVSQSATTRKRINGNEKVRLIIYAWRRIDNAGIDVVIKEIKIWLRGYCSYVDVI